MHDIDIMCRGNGLAKNRHNELPFTAQIGLPDKGRAIKGSLLSVSIDFEPAKWSGPKLLSTVPKGMNQS